MSCLYCAVGDPRPDIRSLGCSMQPTEELALPGFQEIPGRKLGSRRSGERERSLGQGEATGLVQGCRFSIPHDAHCCAGCVGAEREETVITLYCTLSAEEERVVCGGRD